MNSEEMAKNIKTQKMLIFENVMYEVRFRHDLTQWDSLISILFDIIYLIGTIWNRNIVKYLAMINSIFTIYWVSKMAKLGIGDRMEVHRMHAIGFVVVFISEWLFMLSYLHCISQECLLK
jgi:G:T-mismatch repair DNA endonuclease (very short patch repair protein)